MKAGGAEFRIIEGGRRTDLPGRLARAAQDIQQVVPDMAGFYVVGWDFYGGYSVNWRTHEDSPFPPRFLPGIIAEIMRREVAKADTLELMGEDPYPDLDA